MRRSFTRDERGNLAVEFALLSPIFLILLVAVADLGIASLELSDLRASARAGLQAVINDRDDLAGAESAAQFVAPQAAIVVEKVCACADGSEVLCTGVLCPTGGVQQIVTVTASRDLTLLVPWPGFQDPMPLSGIASARVR